MSLKRLKLNLGAPSPATHIYKCTRNRYINIWLDFLQIILTEVLRERPLVLHEVFLERLKLCGSAAPVVHGERHVHPADGRRQHVRAVVNRLPADGEVLPARQRVLVLVVAQT